MKVEISIKSLRNTKTPAQTFILEVPRSGCILGRRSTDCTINDPAVSAKHLILFSKNGVLGVQDLSRNGTYINSVRIQSGILAVGAELKIGDTCLTILRMKEAEVSHTGNTDPKVVTGWPGNWEALPKSAQREFGNYKYR